MVCSRQQVRKILTRTMLSKAFLQECGYYVFGRHEGPGYIAAGIACRALILAISQVAVYTQRRLNCWRIQSDRARSELYCASLHFHHGHDPESQMSVSRVDEQGCYFYSSSREEGCKGGVLWVFETQGDHPHWYSAVG